MPDFKYNGKIYYNPVQLVMEQIGGTWKAPILWRLKNKTMPVPLSVSQVPDVSPGTVTETVVQVFADETV